MQEPPLPVIDGSTRVDLKSLSRAKLDTFVTEVLGDRTFRAEQIYNWMYARDVSSFDAMTTLPKGMRAHLADLAVVHPITLADRVESADGTNKLVFRLNDGANIEAVWIPNADRNTLCISTQVGCAMGCTFCLTAKMGLSRNLTVGEIVDQVVQARQIFPMDTHGRLTNVVYMGMGEPLHNYDNVVASLAILTDDKGLGLSRRKVTVSTSGLVPALKQFGQDANVMLAVSLNATTDEVRDQIMPVNRRYPIAVLLEALRDFPLQQRKRITIEYVLLDGINDSLDDARRLVKLLRGIPTKINLIPWNPHEGSTFRRPDTERIVAFQKILLDNYYNALIRETRGVEAMAACGQLGKPGADGTKRIKRRQTPQRERPL